MNELVGVTSTLSEEAGSHGGKPFACLVVHRQSGDVVHEATNQVSRTGNVSAWPRGR